MKLVEAETPGPPLDETLPAPSPPRPEHRRVAVSFLVTLVVLVATVVVIYAVFPKRDNALVTATVDAHQTLHKYDLAEPTFSELRAWSIGVLGIGAPWPQPQVANWSILGAKKLMILQRSAAFVRYRLEDQEVSMVLQRARDAPPRTHRREYGQVLAVSWRKGGWTCIAVGSAGRAIQWRKWLGTP